MNRNLSKRPKVVRRLDGALTAWRYFHGPNFVHEARDRLKIRTHSDPVRALLREATARSIQIEENQALFAVLVAFVEWMQAPISPWAGSPFVEFVDETGTRKEARRPIGIWLDIETRIAGAPREVSLQTHRDSGRLPSPPIVRSNIARAMSKGRPGSPFYVTLIGERPLGVSSTSIPKFYKAPR